MRKGAVSNHRALDEEAVQRPDANEGGREEEENPPGISAGWAGRLRDENRFDVSRCP